MNWEVPSVWCSPAGKTISNRVIEKLREGEMVYIVDCYWYDEFPECSATQ